MNAAAMPACLPPDERLIRLPEVKFITGLGRSTIYKKQQSGEFPQSLHLGPHVAVWRLSSIREWMADQIEASKRDDD